MKKPIPIRTDCDILEEDFDSFDEFIQFTSALAANFAVIHKMLMQHPDEVHLALQDVRNETLLIVLKFSNEKSVNKVLAVLSKTASNRLRQNLQEIGSVSLSDLYHATEEFAEVCQRFLDKSKSA